MLQSDFERSHAENERAAELAGQLSDAAREGTGLAGMAMASFLAHRFDRATEEAERATAIGRRIGSDGIIAAAKCTIGWVEAVTGRLDDGIASFEEAYQRSTEAGSGFHQALSSAVLSHINVWRGNFEKSAPLARRALKLGRESNSPLPYLISTFIMGLSLTGKGEYDEGLAVFAEGLQLAEKVGDEIWRNRLVNCVGWVHAECGDAERAIVCNEQGIGVSRERGDPEVLANCELNLADLAHAQNDSRLALEYLDSVYALARKPRPATG
jgi:tetratricopeptide (TPR) repeat protein